MISRIITPIATATRKYTNKAIDGLNRTAAKAMDSNFARTLMPENPTDIAKTLALISTTTKDIVNCYYYTTQSYNNQKIPEENRAFVAGIDLANGILNVITQLSLGIWMNKNSDKIYEKLFKGGFNPSAKEIADFCEKTKAQASRFNLMISPENVKQVASKINKVAKSGFSVIAVLVVTQIIAKRVIVPFLSTPLAGYFKKYMDKKKAGKQPQVTQQTQPVENDKKQKEIITGNINFGTKTETFKGFDQFLNR